MKTYTRLPCWLKARDQEIAAKALAHSFCFEVQDTLPTTPDYLIYDENGLSLHQKQYPQRNFHVNFLSKQSHYRQAQLSKKNELIIRALGKQHSTLKIFDLTAGFGQDAFLVASLGHRLILVEQHPIVAALLQDGLNRLQQAHTAYAISLYWDNSEIFLRTRSDEDKPDIIYLDPMFPENNKSALVKRPLQILQTFIGYDDNHDLLSLAREHAKQRVIVKRPKGATPYHDISPDFSLENSQIRFDIYLG